jgi:PAS domain S-box-containing protein
MVWIFAAQALITVILGAVLPADVRGWARSVIDASMLVVAVGPLVYYLRFRPLALHVREHRRTKRKLRNLHRTLERRSKQHPSKMMGSDLLALTSALLDIVKEERTIQSMETNRMLRTEAEKRLRAMEGLRHSENRYQMVVENSLTGIFVYRDNRFTFVNKQFAEMLGYPRPELLQIDSHVVFHPEDREWVSEMGRRRLAGEEAPTEYEARMVTKNGATIWANLLNMSMQYRGRLSILGNVLDITARKQAERALQDSQRELRLLSAQLLTAQEEERARIARELHDSVGQSLSGVKFIAESALIRERQQEFGSVREALELFVPKIQQTIEEVRRLSMALRPSILDDLGLLETISWHCQEFQSSYLRTRLDTHIAVREEEIPDPLKLSIYRILQEALNNVTKHSGADRVVISLAETAGVLQLTVEDNGRGFAVESVSSQDGSQRGFGLGSMRERAYLSGGTVSVNSAEGNGTIVQAVWPLEKWKNHQLSIARQRSAK